MTKDTKKVRVIIVLMVTFLLVIAFAALFMFTYKNKRRITSQNREYLIDNTQRVADSIDTAIIDGYKNVNILSTLISESLDSPEFDISELQGIIQDSVFDFVEFADKDGMDHNITGGVSDASDRQYYLDAKAGNSGMELIYVSRATHETLLMFYAPVYYQGEFVGSIVGVYQTSNRISELLSSKFFGESAMSYLATEEGRIIAASEGYDPQKEMYVWEIAEGDPDTEAIIANSLKTGETATFSIKENLTGGCMQKLQANDWYVVQIFPQQASNRMVADSNKLGYILVGILLVVYIFILISLVNFYRIQRKRVQNAIDQAEAARSQAEAAKVQAEEANRAKTTFLFNMSHDIRTPLNAILGFTDMAEKNIDDKSKLEDCLRKVKQSGNLLLSLINSVLEMSRIESGKAELDEQPGKVEHSFKSVASTMQELAKKKNIDLTFEIGEIRDDYVYADMTRGNRIFVNIISNSIKYTNSGGHIKVKCEQIGRTDDDRGLYRYTFSDNGIGMSEEFQKKLFDEFARENTSTASGVQGTGLGLSVVKTFVDMMGGTIECKSKQGVGTTFTVVLPFRLQKGDIQYIDPETGGAVKLNADGEEKSRPDLAGKRILVVEDNELNREIVVFLLKERGIIVDEADDGITAVSKVREHAPDYYDAILMDIQMRIMDGYEATKAIRGIYPDAKLPIIALSANAFAEDRAASLAAGMNAHVAKPINADELYDVLSKYINKA